MTDRSQTPPLSTAIPGLTLVSQAQPTSKTTKQVSTPPETPSPLPSSSSTAPPVEALGSTQQEESAVSTQPSSSSPVLAEAAEPLLTSHDANLSEEISYEPETRKKKDKKAYRTASTLFGPKIDLDLYPPPPEWTPGCGWGTCPMPPDGKAPRDHDSPPASATNGRVSPDLWEDRKAKFVVGGGDQSDKLPIKLLQVKKDENGNKIFKPSYWTWGMPLDWDDKQTIKTINDRRKVAIERETGDEPWTVVERNYLASLFKWKPEISMLEAAERFNYHFQGNYPGDGYYGSSHGQEENHFGDADKLREEPRTLESIRAQYLEHKEDYDQGKAPKVKKTPKENALMGPQKTYEARLKKEKAAKSASTTAGKSASEMSEVDVEASTEVSSGPTSTFTPEQRVVIQECIVAQLAEKTGKFLRKGKEVPVRSNQINFQELKREVNPKLKELGLLPEQKGKPKNFDHNEIKADVKNFEERYRNPAFNIAGPLDADARSDADLNSELLALAGVDQDAFPETNYSFSFRHEEREILNEINASNAYAYENFSTLAQELNRLRNERFPELQEKNRTIAMVRMHWEHYGGCYQQDMVPGPEYNGWTPSQDPKDPFRGQKEDAASPHVGSTVGAQNSSPCGTKRSRDESEGSSMIVVEGIQKTAKRLKPTLEVVAEEAALTGVFTEEET